MDHATQDEKLNKVIEMLIQFGQGDFSARATVDEQDDRFNNILTGLNMLGEELVHYNAQLESKSTLLQNILENISEVVYTMHVSRDEPNKVFIDFISPYVKEMIGYTAEELLDDPWSFYKSIHPDDVQKLISTRTHMLETGQESICTYRVKPKEKDGYVWIEDKMTPRAGKDEQMVQFFCCARDITAKKEAVEALEQKNKLISRIIATSDQFFYVVSYDEHDPFSSHVSYASDHVTAINGATVEEAIANPYMWYEGIHPDDIDHVVETNRNIFRTGKAAMRMYRVRHVKTGEYTWVEDYVYPSYDKNRRVTELYGSVRIITERKEYEERINSALDELKKQQLFIDTILNSSPIEIVVFDDQHRYLYISKQAVKDEEMRQWLIGKDDFDYCRRKGADMAIAHRRRDSFNEAVHKKKDSEILDILYNKQGEKIYILRKHYPYFENDRLKYVFGYGIDITELKRAELNLAEKENYLRALINSVPDLILRVDKDGTLLDFKAQPGSTLAERLQNFRGKTLHDLWSEQASLHMEKIDEAIQNKRLINYEYEIINATQKKRVFEVRVVSNEQDEVVMIVRNITETKIAEEEKEKLINELNNRYNELMQYNNIVSHNLRAPVARMMGLASLLEGPLTETEKNETVAYMAEAARSLDTLLIDLNTILSAKSSVNTKIESFSIAEVIEVVKDNLKAQIESSDAVIHADIEVGADNMSSVKSYIQSALFNLILNAIKYKQPGQPPVINIKVEQNAELIKIRVCDNGIGIDLDKYRGELFGLYKRFNWESEGKGLGLHMTKTQIESLGGRIEVDSQPGRGTTFTILLHR